MKRIIAIALLLALALCLCACGSDNKEARYVGTWEATVNESTMTLSLNEDGTASLVVTGEDAATYNMKWVATGVFNITLSWDGTPVPAKTKDDAEQTVTDTTEEVVVEETAEDVVEEAVEETVAEVPVETPAADDTTTVTTSGTVKKNDPSIVGFGGLKVVKGQMWLYFSEGSNEDILLFTYAFKKIA